MSYLIFDISLDSTKRSFGLLKRGELYYGHLFYFYIKAQAGIICVCWVFHNFIRIEKNNDQILESQDLEFSVSFEEKPIDYENQRKDGIMCDHHRNWRINEISGHAST